MKKAIYFITVLLLIVLAAAKTSTVFARWSPTANFNKAERAALRNGVVDPATGKYAPYDPKTFSTKYVQSLFLQGKITQQNMNTYYPTQLQQLIYQIAPKVAGGNPDLWAPGRPCAPPATYATDPACAAAANAATQALINKINSGAGLTASDIFSYYGALTCGTKGAYCNGGYSGYYAVLVAGNCAGGCYVFYPIGAGPNPGAKQYDVITPTPTPPPPGIIRARAATTATIPTTCDQIKAATSYNNGQQFDLKLGTVSQGVKTQSGSSYVSWTLQPNTFRLVPLNTGYHTVRICLTDGTGSHFGQNTDLLASSVTDTFDVALGPPPPWFQGQGGEVYSAGSVTSSTNVNANPRQFVLNGGSGYPGVVSYGGASTDYDFSMDDTSKGETYVSSKNWLANDKAVTRDLYGYFYAKFGSPTTADYTSPGNISLPTYDATKSFYYVKGGMGTSGDWTIPDGQGYVFLVDGDLTLNGKVNITGSGFIAFIASGNINIASSVGTAFNSVTPVVEGIYIAGNTLHTGTSTVAGLERFVGRGIFVGNDVALERDLTAVDATGANSSELFIYNPGLLVLMPDIMKSVPVSWQEVAP